MKLHGFPASLLIASVLLISAASVSCASEPPTSTATPTTVPAPTESLEPIVKGSGHDLFNSKGCAACHGRNAEGSPVAPALPGHTEEMVKRQVRNPRFLMPAFGENQINDRELETIAQYIAGLEGGDHAHPETIGLTVAVEMHHWMALEALKAGVPDEAMHHVEHIIELLEPGAHREQMVAVLKSLRAGEKHEGEHEIEGMLAGTAAPDLSLLQLHLRQALVSLAVNEAADARHHIAHPQDVADESLGESLREILDFLDQDNLHSAEHEIQELLGEGEDRGHQ